MKKNIATRFNYECKGCGTLIEVIIPYTFPDGSRFIWKMEEVMDPQCPAQYTKTSGYPASHEVKCLKVGRVKEE